MTSPASEALTGAASDAVAEQQASHVHRPHLDGLRAVAVYMVVAFHTGIGRASGGFIGVDVFFVLSGYLVTQVLLRDVAVRGSVDLTRFYARRVRRLLPAAAVVLVATAAVFVEVGAPAEWDAARDGIRASALYVANWFFIAQSADYFAADIESNPVMHFWSLAVEEQFYVLWPLVLMGLHRVTRSLARPHRMVQTVVVGAAAASLISALLISRDDLSRAYFGTDTRVYQLLLGALLAMTPGLMRRVGRAFDARTASAVGLAALGCLVGLSSHLLEVDAVQRGALAAVITVVLIVLLDAASAGPLHRLLALPPVVYLGRISYGTYLWHWLVVIVLARELDLSTPQRFGVTVVVTSGLAALSFELLEHPIRTYSRLDRHRGPVIAVGLAMSLVVALVVAPRILAGDAPAARGFETAAPGIVEDRATGEIPDWRAAGDDIAALPDCHADNIDGCRLVEGSGEKLLLLGDSHARMLIPLFENLADRMDLSLSAGVAGSCPWIAGLRYANSGQECIDAQEAWHGPVIDAIDPDVVVVAHRAVDDPVSPVVIVGDDTSWLDPGTDEFDALLREQTIATVEALRARGALVVMIEPIPITSKEDDPLQCLSRGDSVALCRFVANMSPLAEEVMIREVAAGDPGVWSLDIDQATCPHLPICDPVVDGLIVRRDNTHLTTRYARTLVDGLERYLLDNEILR